MELREFFERNPRAALGFSGGVDSAYLLYEALRCGADIRPYYVKTPFQPRFELQDALRFAEELGIEVEVVEYDILGLPEVAANTDLRCYHCKSALFGLLQRRAVQDGFALLTDGANASDDAADRPGMKALRELSVRSPLRECGMTKREIRRLSKEAGLFTWNKPAYSCLATRIPVNCAISAELLARVEAAETALFSLGFTDFRVRVYDKAARLQFPAEQIETAAAKRDAIVEYIKPYFETVLLDMEGRKSNG